MGKCPVKPVVQTTRHAPPKLKWNKIFLGNEPAGDILASFELILVIIFCLIILFDSFVYN